MASVFLSYDHEDAILARPIAAALEKAGHTVWYDRHIHGGAQYSHKIEQALSASDAVMVLWTPRSLDSAWVRDEAAEGRDRGKLVPLSIAGVTAPMGFRQFQTIRRFETQVRRALGEFASLGERYVKARKDPSDANVENFTTGVIRSGLDGPRVAFVAQALGEMGRVNEFYDFLRELRVARMLQVESYVLFRPWLDKQRRDPRFIALAARLGLVDYWRSSGQWPDYCSEPDLPYDCKAEAAKHG